MQNRWFRDVGRLQWSILAIAWLGWVFDIFDSGLFNVTKITMLTELLGKEGYKADGPRIEGIIQALFLLGWSAGGLLFGILADRWGRVRTMALSIGAYCLCTGLTALCATWPEVAISRMLTGIGIGGEWAAGAALLAEVFPNTRRPMAAGLLQTAAAIGPFLLSIVLITFSHSSWRVLYLVGIAPALVAVVARLSVKEPPRRHIEKAPLRALFSQPASRRNALLALAIGFAGIAGAGIVSFWLPNLIKETLPTSMSADAVNHRIAYGVTMYSIGTLLGVLVFPLLCERWGRKLPIGIFFVFAPISILGTAWAGKFGYDALIGAVPVMSFFAIGSAAGFALYFPELFPSSVRATGAGFAYNTGRVLTAPVPLLTGLAIQTLGNSPALGVAAASIFYLVGLAALPFAPETKGQPLPE